MRYISKSQKYLLLFLTGFLGLSFEILGLRLFTPYFGSSIVQTSIVIGIVLIFLSAGIYFSDKKENYEKNILRNFIILSFYLCLVLNQVTIFYVANLIKGINVYLGLFIISILILGPISFAISQFTPIFIHQWESERVGMILSLSTIGSFVGSVGTSLLLFYYFSVSHFLVLNFTILFLLIFLYDKKILFKLIPIFITGIILNLYGAKILIPIETGVANYEVTNNVHFKGFAVNGNKYSSVINYIDNKPGSTPKYVADNFLKHTKNRDILILGAAGFTTSYNYKQHNYTYVDLDPKLKDIVKKNFIDLVTGKYISSDARAFISTDKGLYDVIFNDVFEPKVIEPPLHLTTVKYAQQVKKRLKRSGVFIYNVAHAGSFGKSRLGLKLLNTFSEVFNFCYVVPIDSINLMFDNNGFRQTLIICNNVDNLKNSDISTDNKY